jgi:hypothetical protein
VARAETTIAATPGLVRREVLEYAASKRWKLLSPDDATTLEFRWRSFVNLAARRQDITVTIDDAGPADTRVIAETYAKYKGVRQPYDWGHGKRLVNALIAALDARRSATSPNVDELDDRADGRSGRHARDA